MPPKNPVKQLRDHLDLTQGEFAKQLQCRQSRVSEVENGKRLTASMALRIWDRWRRVLVGLGIKLEHLLRVGRAK